MIPSDVNKYAQKRVDFKSTHQCRVYSAVNDWNKDHSVPAIRSGDFNFAKNMVLFKGWLHLFVDYVDSRVKGQLQKLHYLSEFLRLRKNLNFFQQRMSRRFI